jgi:hypothetical protein
LEGPSGWCHRIIGSNVDRKQVRSHYWKEATLVYRKKILDEVIGLAAMM